MAICDGCARAKAKREEHLAVEGYIECRASDDAGQLLQAFTMYTKDRRSTIPFLVVGVPGHPGSAWPLQFQPDSIVQCDGRVQIAHDHDGPESGLQSPIGP